MHSLQMRSVRQQETVTSLLPANDEADLEIGDNIILGSD
jgi:hypothetical protein